MRQAILAPLPAHKAALRAECAAMLDSYLASGKAVTRLPAGARTPPENIKPRANTLPDNRGEITFAARLIDIILGQ